MFFVCYGNKPTQQIYVQYIAKKIQMSFFVVAMKIRMKTKMLTVDSSTGTCEKSHLSENHINLAVSSEQDDQSFLEMA